MELFDRPVNVNITSLTIIKIILIGVFVYFLYIVRDILALFFVALVLASAFDPLVDWLEKRKIPRSLGIIIIYAVLFAFISLIVYLIVPPLIKEISDLSVNSPAYLEKLNTFLNNSSAKFQLNFNFLENIKNNIGSLGSNLETAIASVFTTITTIFGGLVSFILILVLIFYMTVEEDAMKKLVWSIAPAGYRPYIMNLIERMQKKMGLWLRGQLILIVVLFILLYIGFLILGVKYALILAIFVGVVQIVPFLGPIIGAIPVFILTYLQSPLLMLFVAIFYLIVQTIENNFLVPKIMQKTVGLNPVIVILAMLVGFQLAGVIGAVLSLPVATMASVFLKDFSGYKKEKNKAEI